MSSSDSGVSNTSIRSQYPSSTQRLAATILPAEQLVEVLRILPRFDLDKAQLSCKLLLDLIGTYANSLARRLVNFATIRTENKRYALEPTDVKIHITATGIVDGELMPFDIQKLPLAENEENMLHFFTFLAHSYVRRLDVSIRMTWNILELIRQNLRDVSVQCFYSQCGGLKPDITRELLLSTFGDNSALVVVDTPASPMNLKYGASQFTNDFLRSALDKGVRGLYLPPTGPRNAMAYLIDIDGVEDFCLRPTGDSKLRELLCCPRISAADIVRFLQTITVIDHRFVLTIHFMNVANAATFLQFVQAQGYDFRVTPYGVCSLPIGTVPMQLTFLDRVMTIRGGKASTDGTEFFVELE